MSNTTFTYRFLQRLISEQLIFSSSQVAGEPPLVDDYSPSVSPDVEGMALTSKEVSFPALSGWSLSLPVLKVLGFSRGFR